jgi:hypothetical protein
MNFSRALAVLLPLSCIAAFAWQVAAATGESFDVRLSPAPRDSAMRKTIAGKGAAKATLAGNQLTIEGTFDGFPSPATHAEIHRGPAVGMRGPAIYELTVSNGTSGTLSGSFTLSDDALAGLNSGQLYIQVASAGAPDGNVWGWLLPAAAPIVRDK